MEFGDEGEAARGFLKLRGCRLGLGKRGRRSSRIDRVSGCVVRF